MATAAESPPLRYSKLSIMAGSTQPLPVVVNTTRLARWKPPARSRSSTALVARSSVSAAVLSPAYARIGSIAGTWTMLSISDAVGPLPVNLRP